jgi:hypothetical protein
LTVEDAKPNKIIINPTNLSGREKRENCNDGVFIAKATTNVITPMTTKNMVF